MQYVQVLAPVEPAVTGAAVHEATRARARAACSPLFVVHISLPEGFDSLPMSPIQAGFANGVASVMNAFVETSCSVERMLENEELVGGVVEVDDVDVQTAMRDLVLDSDFDAQRSAAEALVAESYAHACSFKEQYERYRCSLECWSAHL
jgi:hypothetical protein